jgi:hypothetical protein
MPSSMPKSRTRPDPVSCQSCRSKKLKCNRVQPCSNCTARGITCNFLVPPQRRTVTHSTTRSNVDLLARIERLEAMIQRTPPDQNPSSYFPDDSYSGRTQVATPSPGSILVSDIHQNRDEDSHLLENVGTREDAMVGGGPDSRLPRVLPSAAIC